MAESGKGFAGTQVAVATEIKILIIEFEAEFSGSGIHNFDAFLTTSGPVPSPGITAMLYDFMLL